MRTFIITLLSLAIIHTGQAEDFSAVKALADQYWAAIRSKDPEKIYALYDPAIFNGLTPEEVALIKEKWMTDYLSLAAKEGDSYDLGARRWDADETPFAGKGWHWPIKPEYQFQIQTFRDVPNGKESITVISDLAVQRDGKFMIIRPVPTPEKAKELLQKKNG